MKRIMRFVYNAAALVFLGFCMRWLCAYGREWRFGKFWTPTPILTVGEPVTSVEGMLAVSGALPYLTLLMLGFIVCQIARVALHSYLIPKRLEKLRRELEGIKHLPDGEHQVAFAKIMARHRKRYR